MRRMTEEAELDAAVGQGDRLAVLFHATWCPFCRKFRPVFEALVKEAAGFEAVEVVLDDEANPLWERFALEVIPTVVIFESGRQIGRIDGTPAIGLSEDGVRGLLKDAMASAN